MLTKNFSVFLFISSVILLSIKFLYVTTRKFKSKNWKTKKKRLIGSTTEEEQIQKEWINFNQELADFEQDRINYVLMRILQLQLRHCKTGKCSLNLINMIMGIKQL